jgi:hypothetical protein
VRRVLLVSTAHDAAVARVATALEARGAEAIRFDSDAFPTDAKAWLRLDGQGEDVAFESAHGRVALSELAAIWLRRLDVAARLPAEMDERYRAPSRDEAHTTLVGLLALFRGRVIDRLAAIQAAGDKPRQLQLARSLGLDIPRTLITNVPDEVRRFAATCPDGLITKSLSAFTVRDDRGEQLMYTSAVGPADLDDLYGLRLCPMAFQEQVAKQLEVRATIVGRRVFAAAVDSSTERGRVDWRRDGEQLDERWQPHALPGPVADRLLALVAAFGLSYSAADLIVAPDGRYVFLESNPAGEWLWLEHLLGLGIPDALAAELLSDAPPA